MGGRSSLLSAVLADVSDRSVDSDCVVHCELSVLVIVSRERYKQGDERSSVKVGRGMSHSVAAFVERSSAGRTICRSGPKVLKMG